MGSNRGGAHKEANLTPAEWTLEDEPPPVNYLFHDGSGNSVGAISFSQALFYLEHPERAVVELSDGEGTAALRAAGPAVQRWVQQIGEERHAAFLACRYCRVKTASDTAAAAVAGDPWRFYDHLESYVREELRGRGVFGF